MFVNVACGLVLAYNVEKACHQGSSMIFFFFCRGVAVLKIALRSWRTEGKVTCCGSEVPK